MRNSLLNPFPCIYVHRNCPCYNRCLFFGRLKINHEFHEFILDPGTVANSYHATMSHIWLPDNQQETQRTPPPHYHAPIGCLGIIRTPPFLPRIHINSIKLKWMLLIIVIKIIEHFFISINCLMRYILGLSWEIVKLTSFFCCSKEHLCFICTVSECDDRKRTHNTAVYTWRLGPLSYGRYHWIMAVTAELRPSLLSYGRHRWATAVMTELRMSPLSYGHHQLSYGHHQLSYGHHQLSYGRHQLSYGRHHHCCRL